MNPCFKNGFVQGKRFVFTNPIIQKIWRKTQDAVHSRDPYTKLEALEKKLRDFIIVEISTTLSGKQRGQCELEARRALVLINMAQIKLLEEELGEDIDGDGIVGFGKIVREAA